MTISLVRSLAFALVLLAAAPALAADGELHWGLHVSVEESGAHLIPGFAYSAPFEDLKLKK